MSPYRQLQIRIIRLLAPLALAASVSCVIVAKGADFSITPFPPDGQAQLIVADGWAYIVRGTPPVPVCSWQIGADPMPPVPVPIPERVAGVWIIEEQVDRTAAEGKVLDDPVWQAAVLARGLTYRIEDKDHPKLPEAVRAAAAKLVPPVVCLIDSDGAVISVVPLPATVEEMRTLIGGSK